MCESVFRQASSRLFVASHVLDSLSEDEVLAAVAHERGHLAARDNLKRMLLRVCCDMMAIVPRGKTIGHAWTGSSEGAKDEYAASLGCHYQKPHPARESLKLQVSAANLPQP